MSYLSRRASTRSNGPYSDPEPPAQEQEHVPISSRNVTNAAEYDNLNDGEAQANWRQRHVFKEAITLCVVVGL